MGKARLLSELGLAVRLVAGLAVRLVAGSAVELVDLKAMRNATRLVVGLAVRLGAELVAGAATGLAAVGSIEGLVRQAMSLAPGLELGLVKCSLSQAHGLHSSIQNRRKDVQCQRLAPQVTCDSQGACMGPGWDPEAIPGLTPVGTLVYRLRSIRVHPPHTHTHPPLPTTPHTHTTTGVKSC